MKITTLDVSLIPLIHYRYFDQRQRVDNNDYNLLVMTL